MSQYISCVFFFLFVVKTREVYLKVYVNGVTFRSDFSKNFLKLHFSRNEIAQFRINMEITNILKNESPISCRISLSTCAKD